jgi:hypothetical protein
MPPKDEEGGDSKKLKKLEKIRKKGDEVFAKKFFFAL